VGALSAVTVWLNSASAAEGGIRWRAHGAAAAGTDVDFSGSARMALGAVCHVLLWLDPATRLGAFSGDPLGAMVLGLAELAFYLGLHGGVVRRWAPLRDGATRLLPCWQAANVLYTSAAVFRSPHVSPD